MNYRIALAGNPNCGKTTLYNALTGSNQFVGNWPGVTVEKKEGEMKKHEGIIITDLPGIYSMSPYTMEEVVARNYLVIERPDAILNIVDGTNLERNLYLTTQLKELGIPVVIAINMMDVVEKSGDQIDLAGLSRRLGCPVLEISALKGTGILEAAEAAIEAAKNGKTKPMHCFSGPVEHALAHIEEVTVHHLPAEQQRWYAVKLFERDERVRSHLNLPESTLEHIEEDITEAEHEMDDDAESIIANERYNYIEGVLKTCYKKKNKGRLSTSDKIDRIVTNRWAALPIFAAIMFLVYFISVTTVGTWMTDFTNDGLFGEGFELFGKWIPGIPVLVERGLASIHCAEWLSGLILDGIVAGVGAVLGFVPQILVLFLFLAFLEACGYMSRIAFVLDRIFRKFGLSGKSFIPMLIGTGCSVPGILASRTVENESDRRMTIITTSFIPCGAKLPFIALIAGAIFGGAWWVAPSAYFFGILAVLVSGVMLKKTKPFASEPAPFVMELPAYHMPTFVNIMRSMWERGWSFIKKAGTVILLSSVVIWFVTYFGFVDGSFRMLSDTELEYSLLAGIGETFAWIFKPLGFGTWQAAVASITGLVAKENIVGTLSIFYNVGEATVYQNLAASFTTYGAYAFLMFNLLCAPCFAAMGAIKREMNSGKWTFFAIAYQCGLAYAVALIINQLGSLLAGNGNVVGVIVAIALIVLMAFQFFRPNPWEKKRAGKN